MNKKAYLVELAIKTRVIIDLDEIKEGEELIEEIGEKGIKRLKRLMKEDENSYLNLDNLVEIKEDLEVPYSKNFDKKSVEDENSIDIRHYYPKSLFLNNQSKKNEDGKMNNFK